MAEFTACRGWEQQALARLQSRWLLKSVAITLSISVYMVIYFILQDHPQFAVITIPPTPLDRLVAFQPWSLIPYASLWLYISLVPMLLFVHREAVPYLSAAFVLSVVGYGIFWLWPTTITQPGLDWSQYPSIAFLKTVSSAGNACPSMHVAFAVLTVMWLRRLFVRMGVPMLLHGLNYGWCLFIIWSTLALKQHLSYDVLAGAALGGLIGGLHLRFSSSWRTVP